MVKLKVIDIDGAVGIILPEDVAARLRIELGDELFLTEGRSSVTLSAGDPDFDEQMGAAREVMARRRDALRELAK